LYCCTSQSIDALIVPSRSRHPGLLAGICVLFGFERRPVASATSQPAAKHPASIAGDRTPA
jgi:hypothetical protein